MAAGVCRMMAPRPRPMSPIRQKPAPASTTARSTPGWPSAGPGTAAGRAASPAKKAMNAAASPTASATAPNTAAFAASTSGRFGIAASVARIAPEEYSPVIMSTPRTPIRSSPRPNSGQLRRPRRANTRRLPRSGRVLPRLSDRHWRYTGYQVWNKQRRDEVLLDVDDVAAGHVSKMRWNPPDQWVYSAEPTHPPLVSRETFDQVQARIAARSRTSPAPRRPRHG